MVQKTQSIGRTEGIGEGLGLDSERELSEIIAFIRKVLLSSKAAGIVVGLSGGVDSSVTATVCVRAVGSDKVTGALLFEDRTRKGLDSRDARELAKRLGIRTLELPLDPVIKSFRDGFPIKANDRVADGNLKARIRMMSLYYVANSENLLVAGTGDRSEDLIGYFTKYGDGGVDFLPIAHLYKSQVKQLARFLGLPDSIVEKPSSPNLWEGHLATDEIPLDYSLLDKVLVCLFDRKLGPEETAERLGLNVEKTKDILERFRASAHKRSYPAMLRDW